MGIQLTAQREHLWFRKEAGHDDNPVAIKSLPQLCFADLRFTILRKIEDRVRSC
jgi:hypothetical protein